jgi:hypothetical protein
MKNDFIPNEKLNISARKVTDAIWDIQLEIDHGYKYPNTLEAVNNIINDRFKERC